MFDAGNRPLRPPLRTPEQAAPERDRSGKPKEPASGDARDLAVFNRLDREIAREDAQEEETRPKRKRTAATAGYDAARSRRNRQARVRKPDRPEPEAFVAAKRMAIQMAQRICDEFGELLSRADLIRLASVFRSAAVPRRKPGRRPNAQVTAALADWKRGARGEVLFRVHIPGWARMSRWRRQCEKRTLLDAIRSRARREATNAQHIA
jgi:hypothetical protein